MVPTKVGEISYHIPASNLSVKVKIFNFLIDMSLLKAFHPG
jgi:hypothetical protein